MDLTFFHSCFQVRYTFVKGKLELQMPPLFSVVIQVLSLTWPILMQNCRLLLFKLRIYKGKFSSLFFPFYNYNFSVAEMPVFWVQESENGSWHVPVAGNGNDSPQSWLCVSRPRACDALEEDSCMEGTKDSNDICCNSKLLSFGRPESLKSCKNKLQSQASFQESDNKITALACKRKERSPSPSYLHVPCDQRHQ